MVLQTILTNVVHFLPNFALVAYWNTEPLVDNNTGDLMALAPSNNNSFIPVQEKAQLFQLFCYKGNDFGRLKFTGESNIIAITGKDNSPLRVRRTPSRGQ